MKLFVDCWSVSVRGNVAERKTGVKNTFPTEAVQCNMAAAPLVERGKRKRSKQCCLQVVNFVRF